MITTEPRGAINICKTPLEEDYRNQLTFANVTAQKNYFDSVTQFTLTDYTYIRKDNQIKINLPIDKVINCNYLFYNNNILDENNIEISKTYYCFITNIEYINENTSLITFQTDVFQTYQFNIVYNPCFIEREHVNDDTIGKHTVPENLETGEYVINQKDEVDMYLNGSGNLNFYYVFAVSKVPGAHQNEFEIPDTYAYNGVYSGYCYLIAEDVSNASALVKLYEPESSAIKSIFIAPAYWLTDHITWKQISYFFNTRYGILTGVDSSILSHESSEVTLKENILSYIPKNNKLKVYPYVYGIIDNNFGNNFELHLEDLSIRKLKCSSKFAISPGCEIKCFIKNYKESTSDETNLNSFQLGKLPICGWISDEYKTWLNQNSINISAGLMTGIGQVLSSSMYSFTSSQLSGTASGVGKIVSTLGTVIEHSKTPPSINGNLNVGDLNFTLGLYNPVFYQMCIKEEYAKIIDNYFSMFGYKVNVVKAPNITGRTNWNYVKTINCEFEGDIPQKDLKMIKSIFDNGITLWHNPSTMYDYSQSNAIVS